MTKAEFEKWRDEQAELFAKHEFDCNENPKSLGYRCGATATYEMMQEEASTTMCDLLFANRRIKAQRDTEFKKFCGEIAGLQANLAQAREALEFCSDEHQQNTYMENVSHARFVLAAIDIKPVAVVEVGCEKFEGSWYGDEKFTNKHTHKAILIVLPPDK